MIRNLFTNPDSFFDNLESPQFETSAKIISIVALVNISPLFYLSYVIWGIYPSGSLKIAVMVGMLIGIVFGFFGVFVIWFVITCAMVAISGILFDGEGSVRQAMNFTSWGFIPGIFAGLVSSVLLFITYQGVAIPPNPETMAESVNQATSGQLGALTAVLRVPFLCWMGLIWTFAIKHARNIPLDKAALSASIPTFVGILWIMYQVM